MRERAAGGLDQAAQLGGGGCPTGASTIRSRVCDRFDHLLGAADTR
ncbi:MAG: hypothetical protein ABMA25_27275 [Ilumatobacteraceae bacterium]